MFLIKSSFIQRKFGIAFVTNKDFSAMRNMRAINFKVGNKSAFVEFPMKELLQLYSNSG